MKFQTEFLGQVARSITKVLMIACFSFSLIACISTSSRSALEEAVIVSEKDPDSTVENRSADGEVADSDSASENAAKRNAAVDGAAAVAGAVLATAVIAVTVKDFVEEKVVPVVAGLVIAYVVWDSARNSSSK